MSSPARAVVVLIVALGAATLTPAGAAEWTANPRRSELLVHVFKRGLLSGLAHDHHFEVAEWRASAHFDPSIPGQIRVEVVVAARSLRDRQEALSATDREKVNRQATGPDTLDADRFPEIRFEADRLVLAGEPAARPEGVVEGVLSGTLSLHGRERPFTLPLRGSREGDGWRIKGAAPLRQSDFGITPFSGFMGTVRVHDEVVVEFDVALEPAH